MRRAAGTRTQARLTQLIQSIKDAETILGWAKDHVLSIDPDDNDSGDPAVNLADARSELTNASNAIDEAMGLIDELLAPEPTREDLYDA